MIVFPNAKINIGLRILRKRTDGFHDIESVFYPVGMSDILEILPADSIINDISGEISVTGNKVPASGQNLCVKAARLFRERLGCPEVKMHLHKIIPPESGLGGGSSDASFTLMALNEMFGAGLEREHLAQLSAEIGSDCPFFIRNQPTLVTGRGDIMEALELKLEGYFLVMVFPDIRVSTKEAYSLVRPSEEGTSLRDLKQLKPGQWKNLIINQFEQFIFARNPELESIKHTLYEEGAEYASMSGSGSALYGIFKEKPLLSGKLNKYNTYQEMMK